MGGEKNNNNKVISAHSNITSKQILLNNGEAFFLGSWLVALYLPSVRGAGLRG